MCEKQLIEVLVSSPTHSLPNFVDLEDRLSDSEVQPLPEEIASEPVLTTTSPSTLTEGCLTDLDKQIELRKNKDFSFSVYIIYYYHYLLIWFLFPLKRSLSFNLVLFPLKKIFKQ